MENNLVKINPEEFGLQATEAAQVEAVFKPMLEKMSELENEFNEVVGMPIEPTTIKLAKELRLKYVKIRTATAEIHKKAKAYYLAGGRFVDGWKNAQLMASQGKEEKLESIERHFENLEKERKEKLRQERWVILQPYIEVEPFGLGEMTQPVWDALYKGTVDNHNAKIEAEKRAEEERVAKELALKLHLDRKESILHLWNFAELELKTLDLSTLSDQEWANIVSSLNKEKNEFDKNQELQRKENERLKKEAEEKQRQIEKERREQEEKLKKQKEEAEKERKRLEAISLQEQRQRIEAEKKLKQKQEQEEKDRKEAEKQAKKLANAPDKKKIQYYINSLQIEAVELKSIEAINIDNEIRAKLESFKKWALSLTENL